MNASMRAPRRVLSAMLPLALLAACSSNAPPLPGSRAAASPQTMAACRQRADEVYSRQNPNEVYSSDMFAGGLKDTPYAGRDVAGISNRGLSGQYARETMLDDCLRSVAGNIGTSPEPPAAATGAAPLPVPPQAPAARR
jgi:hypothetical protein